jgi:hypothetical protein
MPIGGGLQRAESMIDLACHLTFAENHENIFQLKKVMFCLHLSWALFAPNLDDKA